ncbi:hypothetical protein Tco_0123547 [Tanacetum coccineum]
MESVSAPMVAAAKLLVLNPGKFELWKMRIEQYFLMTDYALWEVIVNGDSPPPKRTVDGVEKTYPPTTAEEKLARKNELKARVQENQKTLLKQQYENFNGSSSEGLDQTYDRLQKIISQLEILGEPSFQEDMNMKFLRSLPLEWKTHTLIWRNKPDLETLSMDDLYNNLKIYETKVKGSSSSSQNSQNVAFVSFNSSGSCNQAHNEDLKWRCYANRKPKEALYKIGRKRSAKNLSKLLEIQVSDKFKTGVGYDSQVVDSQVFDSQVNDKYKTYEGYHAVPLPYTGNFMPPKSDLELDDEDDYVFSESVTSMPAVATSKAKTSELKPKSVSEPLIED